MVVLLKQSTSVVVSFGPFVDKTDGITFETALAGTGANQLEHTSSGILISKNGGTLAARHATATASTYDAYGMYKVTLDTTDTGTLGALRMCMGNNDAIPVWQDFLVVTANVWDTLFGSDVFDTSTVQLLGTALATPATAGLMDVNVKQISTDATAADNAESFFDGTGYAGTNNVIPTTTSVTNRVTANCDQIDGSATAADRLQRSAESIVFCTVGSASTSTSIVTSAMDPAAAVADQFKGRIVIFDKATTTAALRGQATDITASTSGGVLTVSALTTAPASGDTFTIV